MDLSDQTVVLSPAVAISDSGFVFDPRTGQSFSVNSSGLFLLRALRERCSVQDLARSLEAGSAEPIAAERDVTEFVRMLADFGLISEGNAVGS